MSSAATVRIHCCSPCAQLLSQDASLPLSTRVQDDVQIGGGGRGEQEDSGIGSPPEAGGALSALSCPWQAGMQKKTDVCCPNSAVSADYTT